MQLVVPRAVSAAVRTEITVWMMTLHISLFFMVVWFFMSRYPEIKEMKEILIHSHIALALSFISFISGKRDFFSLTLLGRDH